MKCDNYKLGEYLNSYDESRWATIREIQNAGHYINLSDPEYVGDEDYPAGGLPLLSDGKEVYVDNKDTHTLIFGSTGSKKTRLFCMPLINIFAKSGESFIATDPKGELYDRTSGLVEAMGYKIVVLDFRNIGQGDRWNPLSLPYEMYHSDNREVGISMLNDFISAIAAPLSVCTEDLYWVEMAKSFALASLLLLVETAPLEEVNVSSLARMCSYEWKHLLSTFYQKMDRSSIAAINFSGFFSGTDNMQRSTFTMLHSMIRCFNTQRNLTRMLSGTTFDLRKIGREKTAVYILVPDEKTTYHFLVTTFVKQAYEILIAEAQKEKRFKLPIRVNFVLDEFCNMPMISDMPSMISAARSRNMRYYLVAQSLHQLRGKYGEDADTIKGNCDNWVFLTSKELELLQEISELCGSIRTRHGTRRLISVSELQRLDKKKGEALIMHARQYPIITEMADIDLYSAFKGYECPGLTAFDIPKVKVFDLDNYYQEVVRHKKPWPFVEESETVPETAPDGEVTPEDKDFADTVLADGKVPTSEHTNANDGQGQTP